MRPKGAKRRLLRRRSTPDGDHMDALYELSKPLDESPPATNTTGLECVIDESPAQNQGDQDNSSFNKKLMRPGR